MHNFKELIVWQKTRTLVKQVYLITNEFPATEKYNLVSQMQTCAVSIMSNIAEGSGRGSDIDFARFLDMSLGSGHELESLFIVAFDVGYINKKHLEELSSQLSEIQKMIVALTKKLRNK